MVAMLKVCYKYESKTMEQKTKWINQRKSKEFKESDIFCQQFLNLLIIIKFQHEFMYKIEK